MRKLLLCLFVVGVSLVAATPASQASFPACVFRCCDGALGSAACMDGATTTSCALWRFGHSCP